MDTLGRQGTLAMMTGFERYTKKTRRAIFLEEMGQVVPWAKLCALVEFQEGVEDPWEGSGPSEIDAKRCDGGV